MIQIGLLRKAIIGSVLVILLILFATFFGIAPVVFFGVGMALFYYGLTLGFYYYFLVGSAICVLLGIISMFIDFGF